MPASRGAVVSIEVSSNIVVGKHLVVALLGMRFGFRLFFVARFSPIVRIVVMPLGAQLNKVVLEPRLRLVEHVHSNTRCLCLLHIPRKIVHLNVHAHTVVYGLEELGCRDDEVLLPPV